MHAIVPSILPAPRHTPRTTPAAAGVPPKSLDCGVILRESIDQTARALHEHGSFEIQQLEAGNFHGRIEYIRSGETLVLREEYPLKTFISGRLADDCFAISIPVGGPPVTLGGQAIREGLAATAIEGEEIRFLAKPGTQHIILVVGLSRLQQLVDTSDNGAFLMPSIERGRRGMVLPIRSDAARPLLRLLDKVGAGKFDMESSTFEELVYGTILTAIHPADHALGSSPSLALFRRSLALADTQQGTPRVSELATSLKVSPRTLHKAFQNITGVGPAAFFLNRQLHQARKALQHANPTSSKISSIAAQLGITELGRFSVRYRRLFGESPSVTLRRNRLRAL